MKNSSDFKYGLRRVLKAEFNLNPARYEFRENDASAPPCPYGNQYAWIGFDNQTDEYVRFTKSIVKDVRLRKVKSEKLSVKS